MGYQSLVPPHQTSTDDSDNSIQGSPLLDTGSRFFSGDSPSFDFQPETPFQARSDESNRIIEDSPYADGYAEEYYGASDSKGYTGIMASSPAERLTSQDGSPREKSAWRSHVASPHQNLRHSPQDLKKLETLNPEDLGREGFSGRSLSGKDMSFRASAPSRAYSRGMASPSRRDPKDSPSRTTKLASPIEEHSSTAYSTLNFDVNKQRPHSSFIKETFDIADAPTSSSPTGGAAQEDEEDALPFETTKQMAWQGRPKSMVLLSQLESGPVMSHETFENYRKSLSGLSQLKRMTSTGSFRSVDSEHTHGEEGHANSSGPESSDAEPEEPIHEQDRKRMKARIRQEQDARMSVYRQRMTKIVGGTAEPSITVDRRVEDAAHRRSSSSNIMEEDQGDNDEMMDDIPLSILQAHGFPKTRKKSHTPSSPGRPASDQTSPSSSRQLSPHALPSRPLSVSRNSLHGSLPAGAHSPSTSHLTHRQMQLPPVFGNKDAMLSRGLVAEISKEEEYRKRRHTMGYESMAQDLSARQHKQRPASMAPSLASPGELQSKLDQVIAMLSKLSTDGSPAPSPTSATMWPAHPQYSSQRAPSIRSFASNVSVPNNMHPPGPMMYSPYESVPSFYGGPSPMSPFPPVMDAQAPQHFRPASMTPIPMGAPPQPFALYRGAQPPQTISNRPSRMRMVKTGNENEEDEEAEWQKLMEKRNELREQWKGQKPASAASVETT